MFKDYLKKYSELVVFPHTVFALPFALAAFFLSLRGDSAAAPIPLSVVKLVLIIVAVIAARTAAMAFNRLVDADYDAKNPRTAERQLPRGELSQRQVVTLVAGAVVVFLLAAWALGRHCLVLAPVVLLVLFAYSYAKRYTSYAHLVLGLALALAPGGAWWVMRPEVNGTPLLLMFSVLFWVAGFDIIYSCQDKEFDASQGLHSLPVKLGVEQALKLAAVLHCICLMALFLVGAWMEFGRLYFAGVACLGLILISQHLLISSTDLSRANRAFFTFNGFVSVGYLLLILASLYL
ncbi:UbiA family prenyltransferase [bacterium]|nr:UbiA family prenyltransferase [bacterium]